VPKKVIRKRFRHEKDGVQVAGDINAVISTNVEHTGGATGVSSHSRQRIVQRSRARANARSRDEEQPEGSGESEE
jgi:hypothetical protein